MKNIDWFTCTISLGSWLLFLHVWNIITNKFQVNAVYFILNILSDYYIYVNAKLFDHFLKSVAIFIPGYAGIRWFFRKSWSPWMIIDASTEFANIHTLAISKLTQTQLSRAFFTRSIVLIYRKSRARRVYRQARARSEDARAPLCGKNYFNFRPAADRSTHFIMKK